MPGKHSRNKGARVEREIVALHDAIPVAAEKVSGMYKPGEDLCIADEFKAEVKARREGFKLLKRWLEGNDLLFLREDGVTHPMVVMPWETYERLIIGVTK